MSAKMHSVGPFLLGKTLGRGSVGRVKLGVHKDTGFKVAIKIIDKEKIEETSKTLLKKIEKEIVIMKLLNHRNILKLYEVYETPKYLFLILEYAEGGELFDYLVARGSIPLEKALDYFYQIILGLDYCHANFIYHRDLKPENLLLSRNHKVLKIADFGLAAFEPRDDMLKTSCGSPHYASPEIVSGKKYDGRMSDVWSCGVVLYSLVTGRLPFEDQHLPSLLLKIKKGKYSLPQYVPGSVKDLIERMLVTDPSKRLSLDEIKAHPCLAAIAQKYAATNAATNALRSERREKKKKSFFAFLKVGSNNSHNDTKQLRGSDELPIKDEMIEQLHTLGWDHDEIFRALKSSKNSMIKSVYKLLIDREQVPADLYYHRIIEHKDELEEEDQVESAEPRSRSATVSAQKRQWLMNSAPARAKGESEDEKEDGNQTHSLDSPLSHVPGRRTLSDRPPNREVLRVRMRSNTPSPRASATLSPVPPVAPSTEEGSSRVSTEQDATLPPLIKVKPTSA